MTSRARRWSLWAGLLALLGFTLFALSRNLRAPPLAPEDPADARFAPPPQSTVALEVTPLVMGHNTIPRCGAAGGASCLSLGRVVHVAYMVKHPKATFLIDSGLSHRARADLARFALKERLALDWTSEGDLAGDLVAHGSPKIDFVILTHAHWDHTSGLVDLPHPRVVIDPADIAFVRNYPKSAPPSVMPDHLEGATLDAVNWDGPAVENFPRSHDVFGDGSVVLVPLPGHTPGSLGVFVSSVHGKRLFFIGDTSWSRAGYELPSHKPEMMSGLVDADRASLSQSLWRVHELHARDPDLVIVPTHDGDALAEVSRLSTSTQAR